MEKEILLPITAPSLASAIQNIPESLLSLDYEELEELARPTEKDRLLKISLQGEIDRALTRGEAILNSNIVRGICNITHFNRNILTNPNKLAWMLTPSPKEEMRLQLYSEVADLRLKEILNSDITTSTGRLDANAAKIVLQAIKLVKDRTMPIITRQQIHQVTETRTDTMTKSIEERIKQLEEELGKSKESGD